MPSKSAASKPSRRTTTKVAPTGYSATILPWFDLLKSSTNTYVPGFSARTRMLTVLPGGTTFSNLSSLLSTSAAFASLFVTTSANGWPALTFTSAGVNFWFSTVIGISTGLLCASAMGRRASVEHGGGRRLSEPRAGGLRRGRARGPADHRRPAPARRRPCPPRPDRVAGGGPGVHGARGGADGRARDAHRARRTRAR